MEILDISIMWSDNDSDVLTVFVEPAPATWAVDPLDSQVAVFRALDSQGHELVRVVGVEIVDFSTFDRWDELPSLPTLVRLPGSEPCSLVELLRQEQRRLAATATHHR